MGRSYLRRHAQRAGEEYEKGMKTHAITPPACAELNFAVGADGAFYWPCIYAFDNGIGMIRMTTSGKETTYPLLGTKNATPADPRFATLGKDGAIWFTDQNANYIGRFTPSSLSLYAYPLIHGNGASNAGAENIVAAPNGSLYFYEFNTGNVGHIVL